MSSVAVTQSDAYPYHAESHGRVRASAGRAFARLDDHNRLAAHMNRRLWRMAWGRMNLQLDERAGRAPGSRIRIAGRVLGVLLSLEEVVTEHTPPTRKAWETVGAPRLLVIGSYRMGFALVQARDGAGRDGFGDAALTVFIDDALPDRGPSRLFGRILAHWYARWCTERIVADAQAAFAAATPPAAV